MMTTMMRLLSSLTADSELGNQMAEMKCQLPKVFIIQDCVAVIAMIMRAFESY
jgi:hypothetical protein